MWHCHAPTATTVIDVSQHQVESAVEASTTILESDMLEEEVSTVAASVAADADIDWASKEAMDNMERMQRKAAMHGDAASPWQESAPTDDTDD